MNPATQPRQGRPSDQLCVKPPFQTTQKNVAVVALVEHSGHNQGKQAQRAPGQAQLYFLIWNRKNLTPRDITKHVLSPNLCQLLSLPCFHLTPKLLPEVGSILLIVRIRKLKLREINQTEAICWWPHGVLLWSVRCSHFFFFQNTMWPNPDTLTVPVWGRCFRCFWMSTNSHTPHLELELVQLSHGHVLH